MTTWNKADWEMKFVAELERLRPHLANTRVSFRYANGAWHRQGVKGVEPAIAARNLNTELCAADAKIKRPGS
jgi:hypothetical protein